jgi:hypothetical protein
MNCLRAEAPEGDAAMNDDFEVTRGKGNVFRDFGYADADAQHLKAVLAAQIIKVLDVRKMSARLKMQPGSLLPTSPASARQSSIALPSIVLWSFSAGSIKRWRLMSRFALRMRAHRLRRDRRFPA